MGVPVKAFTAAALAGGALWTHYTRDEWSRAYLFKAFSAIWLVEFGMWFIWTTFVYPHFVSPLRHLPSPKGGHWLLGFGRKMIAGPLAAPMREWILDVPNDGIIRHLWFFNRERLLVTSPKALSEVLVTNNYAFHKPDNVRSALARLLGYGLLLAEGDEHKRQRRHLMPAFAFRHIKDLYPVFWNKSREATQAIAKACGSEGLVNIEVGDWASRCALDIVGVAGLGRDFHAIQNKDNELVRTYHLIFQHSPQARILHVAGLFIPMWLLRLLPLKRNGEMDAAAKTIRASCRDLIQEKKAKLASSKERFDVDILSVALESGQFSDENLVDQLMTFLAAGHETTATALTWAIYMLCRFPEMQTRLRKEVREKLPSTDDADANVTSLDIDHMPYLNAVCSEVLRHYSPVPITARIAAHDTTILGYPVRKGTRVMIAPWATNMDPKLWGPDVNEFNPERWMFPADVDPSEAEEAKKRAASGGATSNYAFMTFLHGPRSCIGMSFAKAEFACLLAAWVGKFEFELVDKRDMDDKNMSLKGGVTIKPVKGVHVKVRVVGGY